MKPRFFSNQKRQISVDEIISLNTFFWENGLNMAAIREKHGVSLPILDRAIFQTRSEWQSFKERNSNAPSNTNTTNNKS